MVVFLIVTDGPRLLHARSTYGHAAVGALEEGMCCGSRGLRSVAIAVCIFVLATYIWVASVVIESRAARRLWVLGSSESPS